GLPKILSSTVAVPVSRLTEETTPSNFSNLPRVTRTRTPMCVAAHHTSDPQNGHLASAGERDFSTLIILPQMEQRVSSSGVCSEGASISDQPAFRLTTAD